MKSKILLVVLNLVFIPSLVNAQFNQFPVGPNWFGRTNGFPFNINAVGIGNFVAPATPQARLHVNNFLLGNQTGPLNGLLFRSDGDQTIDNKWQMFTGTNANKTL